MAVALETKEKLLKNLKEYAELSDKDLDLFRYAVISSDYFTRYDHRGGIISPGQKHYRTDGTEHTLKHVPWKKLLGDVEDVIARQVPQDRRTEVFHKVMDDMPRRKHTPG